MENTIMCYLEYLMYFIIHVRLPCLWQSFILKKSNFRIVLPHIYIFFYLKPFHIQILLLILHLLLVFPFSLISLLMISVPVENLDTYGNSYPVITMTFTVRNLSQLPPCGEFIELHLHDLAALAQYI